MDSGWLSSLGDSVKFNEETVLKIKASMMVAMLSIVTTNEAYAAYNRVDTPTVITVEVVVVDPLDKYREMTKFSPTDLADMLELVGFKGSSLKTAWAVVMRESRGNSNSHNKTSSTGDNSYGLFQINMIGNLGEIRREKFGIKSNAELLDPVTNAQAAFYMTNRGTNFGSWGLGPDAYDGTSSESAVTDWFDDFPK
jgi:hypothetical protein